MAGSTPRSIHDALSAGAEALRNSGVEAPILDSEVLLSHVSGLTRTTLITHPETCLDAETAARFDRLIARRAAREPLAYIVGEREFFGLRFLVSSAVLVPRPETELLVEAGIGFLEGRDNPVAADIGTGSGIIGVSLAVRVPSLVVHCSDSSAKALSVAGENAARHGVEKRVNVTQGSMFDPLAGLVFDAVLSNPPYIPDAEIDKLQPEISRYEPREALDGGPDGLRYYRLLASEAPRYLKPGGMLAVEVGRGQSQQVAEMFGSRGLVRMEALPDYSGTQRVVCAYRCASD